MDSLHIQKTFNILINHLLSVDENFIPTNVLIDTDSSLEQSIAFYGNFMAAMVDWKLAVDNLPKDAASPLMGEHSVLYAGMMTVGDESLTYLQAKIAAEYALEQRLINLGMYHNAITDDDDDHRKDGTTDIFYSAQGIAGLHILDIQEPEVGPSMEDLVGAGWAVVDEELENEGEWAIVDDDAESEEGFDVCN